MIIEFRNNDYETKVHLVNENTEKECFQRIDLSQGMNEYGNGNKLFFFEAAGRYDSAVLDIIHAYSIEEAQELVNETYKDRFERKTIIPLPIKEIIDERLADWTRISYGKDGDYMKTYYVSYKGSMIVEAENEDEACEIAADQISLDEIDAYEMKDDGTIVGLE